MGHLVYLPADPHAGRILPGSGIVAVTADIDHGRLHAHYEGNRYGASGMATWADRLHHAAGRLDSRYPTIAQAILPRAALVHVGYYDTETGRVDLYSDELDDTTCRARVADWLSIEVETLPVQLVTASVARHSMSREISAALASHDPAHVFEARRMARRYNIPI